MAVSQPLSCAAEEESDDDQLPTLKVTWRAKKGDESNGGYSEEVLQTLLSKVSSLNQRMLCSVMMFICMQFGPIHHILVSARKKGKAVVSFHHAIDAVSRSAVDYHCIVDIIVSVCSKQL